jgi:hypothetical protein
MQVHLLLSFLLLTGFRSLQPIRERRAILGRLARDKLEKLLPLLSVVVMPVRA